MACPAGFETVVFFHLVQVQENFRVYMASVVRSADVLSHSGIRTCATRRILPLLVGGWLCCVGCRPSNVADVSGNVTLQGQPLAGAIVTFVGQNSASLSRAITDESGKYTLVYSSNHAGAETGEYAVSISTFKPADTDSEPPTAAVPEKVPARYNLQTELKARVEAGKNVIDFKLEDGPVIQPSDAEEKRENQSILRPC